jgi:hypothetical protein
MNKVHDNSQNSWLLSKLGSCLNKKMPFLTSMCLDKLKLIVFKPHRQLQTITNFVAPQAYFKAHFIRNIIFHMPLNPP